MNRHEIAMQHLFKEYNRLISLLVSDYFLRIKGDDEVKKSIETQDFMTALFSGENIKQEWKLENTETWKKIVNIVDTINFLK